MQNPLVSVVIPTYNRENEILKAITSVLKQTYTNFEIIIVDDASTDQTVAVARSIADPRIKIMTLPRNTNGTLPRNIGIEKSNGEFIALLDSDDEWKPQKLEKQISFIKKINSERFICFTDLTLFDGKSEVLKSNTPLSATRDIMDYIFIDDNCVQTSSFIFPNHLGKEVQFATNVKKHQDWDFCLRLQKAKTNFYHLPEALVRHSIEDLVGKITSNNQYLLSIEWGEKIENYLSKDAYLAFQVRVLFQYYLLMRKRKLGFAQTYLAYQKGIIDKKRLLINTAKCFLPKTLIRKRLGMQDKKLEINKKS